MALTLVLHDLVNDRAVGADGDDEDAEHPRQDPHAATSRWRRETAEDEAKRLHPAILAEIEPLL